jgi:succinate-acetate transporter protein
MPHQATPHEDLLQLAERSSRHYRRCSNGATLGYVLSAVTMLLCIMALELFSQLLFGSLSIVFFLLAHSLRTKAREFDAFSTKAKYLHRLFISTK